MQVRIGISDSGREIDLDVEDADALADQIEAALATGSPPIVWGTDTRGRKVGIPIARIGYIEIAAEEKAAVGFSR